MCWVLKESNPGNFLLYLTFLAYATNNDFHHVIVFMAKLFSYKFSGHDEIFAVFVELLKVLQVVKIVEVCKF